MFQRSPRGTSNQRLFLDVDFVVYVEGVARANNRGVPYDERFWNIVLRRECPSKTFAFRPAGSKTNINTIARQVVSEAVENVLVCMDADYERFTGSRLMHERILYTYGYSWENDICSHRHVEVLLDLFCDDVPSDGCTHEIRSKLARLERIGFWIGRLDIVLQMQGLPLQDKKKQGDLLDITQVGNVLFDLNRVATRIKRIKTQSPAPAAISFSDYRFWRDFQGKTVLFVVYHLVKNIAKREGASGRLGFDFLISRVFRLFEEDFDEPRDKYYKSSCSALNKI